MTAPLTKESPGCPWSQRGPGKSVEEFTQINPVQGETGAEAQLVLLATRRAGNRPHAGRFPRNPGFYFRNYKTAQETVSEGQRGNAGPCSENHIGFEG